MHLTRFACALSLLLGTSAFAQTQPQSQAQPQPQPQPKPSAPAQPPAARPPATAAQPPRPVAATFTMTVEATDKSGNSIANVDVDVSGPVDRTGTTTKD